MATDRADLDYSKISDRERLRAEATFVLSVSGDRFTLTLFNWGFKVSVFPHIWKNPRFGDFALESAQH
jgi:hypothetical protein